MQVIQNPSEDSELRFSGGAFSVDGWHLSNLIAKDIRFGDKLHGHLKTSIASYGNFVQHRLPVEDEGIRHIMRRDVRDFVQRKICRSRQKIFEIRTAYLFAALAISGGDNQIVPLLSLPIHLHHGCRRIGEIRHNWNQVAAVGDIEASSKGIDDAAAIFILDEHNHWIDGQSGVFLSERQVLIMVVDDNGLVWQRELRFYFFNERNDIFLFVINGNDERNFNLTARLMARYFVHQGNWIIQCGVSCT